MIVGIGVDTVEIARFAGQIERTPRLKSRLFTPAEADLPIASLAARFAAKEAIIKALGGSGALSWHDLEVVRGPERAPVFVRTPGLDRALSAYAGATVHVSMTHDGGIATAFVIIESDTITHSNTKRN